MTFNKNIYIIPNGKYISLFSNENGALDFFSFDENLTQYELIVDGLTKYKAINSNFPYNFISKFENGTKLFVCYNNNISVIDNE